MTTRPDDPTDDDQAEAPADPEYAEVWLREMWPTVRQWPVVGPKPVARLTRRIRHERLQNISVPPPPNGDA